MKNYRHLITNHWQKLFSIILLITFSFHLMNCDDPIPQEGGRVEQTPRVEFNPGVVSPVIIIPPLLHCGKSVTVKGFVPGAKIKIYSGATEIGSGIGDDPESQTFKISPDLARGDSITATQEIDGTENVHSTAVVVQDVSEAYPNGFPQPDLPIPYLYNCGIATVVSNVPQGGSVTVFQRPASDPSPGASIGHLDGIPDPVSIGVNPFITDQIVIAQSELCTTPSPFSPELTVHPAPATMPTPESTGLYEGGKIMTIHKLVNGAKVVIKRGGMVIGGGGAPGEHVRFLLNTTVTSGEAIEITQDLCGNTSTPATVVVQPCSSLPPAILMAPRAGDIIVYLTDVVEGSRIRIFSGGIEIADGGGSAIQLTRPLIANETLVVIQSLGNCVASTSYVLEVGHGLNDPLRPGSCSGVESFEYGGGNDPDRQTTDVSNFFNSPDSRVTVPMNAVPLHAVVRYPNGPGPFPIVIIVHGNHGPLDPSYPGYNYLLDHLASHCMIAVSVEEDFLNGFTGGEMDARAIVLLRHLQLWREWNRTPGHRFYGKVDMNRVGLAGHSRGGEAIVAAKLFNHTLHNPADPQFDFNFGIRSLFAIAPVDKQFDNGPIRHTGADYYVMHGSHDGDVADFGGHMMYDRAFPVNNTTNNFKGLLYIYGANHGNWNTVWGSGPGDPIGPAASAISDTDQQLIGKSYITGFFLASLKGWNSYRYFLNGEVTFSSLPASITRVFQYQDPKRIFLDHYEEDDDLSTGSSPGVLNISSGSFDVLEDYTFMDNHGPHFLWGESDGMIAGWRDVENTEIRITIPAELRSSIDHHEFLAFRIGQLLEARPVFNTPGTTKEISVQALLGTSAQAEIHTGDYHPLPYPMVTTGDPWYGGPKSVMQTIRIPLKDLVRSPVDISTITEIRLKFNRHTSGIVGIDEIQFTD